MEFYILYYGSVTISNLAAILKFFKFHLKKPFAGLNCNFVGGIRAIRMLRFAKITHSGMQMATMAAILKLF